ncbi:Uncharacterised protein [Mycobacteroides abscessus]|nr:Uncharacterised protein [Mycobacteroides abscessus]
MKSILQRNKELQDIIAILGRGPRAQLGPHPEGVRRLTRRSHGAGPDGPAPWASLPTRSAARGPGVVPDSTPGMNRP